MSMSGRLDVQRQPGHYHQRKNARLYQRGYKTLPHLVWGDRWTDSAGGAGPLPPDSGSSVPVGTWDWLPLGPLPAEADVSWESVTGESPSGVITIHHIDIPDVDHDALFATVASGWWMTIVVPGKLANRIKVDFAVEDSGVWTFIGAPETSGSTAPTVGDDTTVYLQNPAGEFVNGAPPSADPHVENPGNFTIADLEAWVDDHPDLADEVLAHEEARSSPRVTLVNWLQGFISDRDPGHVP